MDHGLLEQSRAPDQKPIERHGASRSKDNGHPELGDLNQESIGLLRIPYPLDLDGAPYQQPIGP